MTQTSIRREMAGIKRAGRLSVLLGLSVLFFLMLSLTAAPSIGQEDQRIWVDELIERARRAEAEDSADYALLLDLKRADEVMLNLSLQDPSAFGRNGDLVLQELEELRSRIGASLDETRGCEIQAWRDETVSGQSRDDSREWTVLVYAVTDSFLLDTVMADLDEMEGTGCGTSVEVLVQLDCGDHDARRYHIRPDGKDGKVTSPVVENIGSPDCGNFNTLVDFVSWGLSLYPSRRVALVLHGCLGNLGYGAPESLEKVRENGARYMGISHMAKALTAISAKLGRKIDLVLVDDSSSSNVEKIYEYRKTVSHWIASAGFVPTQGLPYDRIIGLMAKEPNIDLNTLSRKTVDFFAESYVPYCNLPFGFGATLTAWDLSKVDGLCESLAGMGVLLEKRCKKAPWRDGVLKAASESLGCLDSESPDLMEWIAGLEKLADQDQEVLESLEAVKSQFLGSRLAHHGAGRYYKRACGLSVTVTKWFGGYGHYDTAKYRNLLWSQHSKWIKFLLRLSK